MDYQSIYIIDLVTLLNSNRECSIVIRGSEKPTELSLINNNFIKSSDWYISGSVVWNIDWYILTNERTVSSSSL